MGRSDERMNEAANLRKSVSLRGRTYSKVQIQNSLFATVGTEYMKCARWQLVLSWGSKKQMKRG